MVPVSVRKQDKIWNWQFLQADRGLQQSLHAQGKRPNLDPYTRTEYRIRENREAIHTNQDRAVTNPSCLHTFSRPGRDIGNER